jgi:hypothetical protein
MLLQNQDLNSGAGGRCPVSSQPGRRPRYSMLPGLWASGPPGAKAPSHYCFQSSLGSCSSCRRTTGNCLRTTPVTTVPGSVSMS